MNSGLFLAFAVAFAGLAYPRHCIVMRIPFRSGNHAKLYRDVKITIVKRQGYAIMQLPNRNLP
jgi:hypothetical protein